MTKATYIKKPRSTEKAIIGTDKNKYVFVVDKRANKDNLYQEIVMKYKVNPTKINIMNTADKTVMRKELFIFAIYLFYVIIRIY